MRTALSCLSLATSLALAACGADDPVVTTDAGPSITGDAARPPPSALVDPTCTDGLYEETPLPSPDASLDGITFTGDIPAFVDEALSRRYPFALAVVEGGRANTSFGTDCSVFYAGSPTTADDLYRRLDVIVHECGHFYDAELSTFDTTVYPVDGTLRFSCEGGDSEPRGGDTFARSRIRGDAHQADRPPCTGGGAASGCDFYADIYLDGDPDDGSFEGGDQGFNMLLEETLQYVSSLATAYAFADRLPSGISTSARDGILTFLWYVERYLALARTTYPDAYQRISGDACWRDAILSIWGRAWLYLELTRGDARLGLDDDAIERLVADPVLLEEIERLRALSGCP
jgi:hypothetical protein